MVRVRVGDTVELTLKNNPGSRMAHSIDLHAVTGPGGGATVTQVPPGEQRTFTFKALHAGLFVYHCATPMIASHIAAGMYVMILVEPEEGLPPVDHEFYVMQGEIYTAEPFGSKGLLTTSEEKVLAERPEYFVFNGSVGALTDLYPMRAKVGEKVRIYFGVGGPNATSSFHMIGEVFDRAYPFASLTSPPLTDVQTLSVPPGGAAVVEMELQVPGKYIMVDHALARAERGLMGWLLVEGPENPGVFHDGAVEGTR
jgi:nitrite reductase (NO-forming)